MAGKKVFLISLLLELCCFTQSIFAANDSRSSDLEGRIEALERKDAERSAENIRQQETIEVQGRQLKRSEDLIENLRDLVLAQALEITAQRNKIEDLDKLVNELLAIVKERGEATKVLTSGISVLRNEMKACTVSNTELSKFVKTLSPYTMSTDAHVEEARRDSDNTDTANDETKSSPDLAQRSSRFLNEGPFAFHAVSDKQEVPHITVGQSIIFENVLLNIGRAFHTNHSLFIAEIPGVYLFSASILTFVNTHSEFTAAIVKNGGNLALVYGHGDAGRHDQGSVTVVTQLNPGDEVWVKHLSPSDGSIYGGRYTTFTGVLVYSL